MKIITKETIYLYLDPDTVKLVFFVPESYKDSVKRSVFAAGAGSQGEYQQCCWETEGRGQFYPSSDANPFCGNNNNINHVVEYRIEMLCPISVAEKVESAIKNSHPYESIPFEFLPLYRT
ncbi:MAG: NGG1p interacting factor NIF3 [Porticoccaceae bacterium]|nr:NGG1p interacting factor NIF3 [Porticoccaceae bacterium]